MNGAAFEVPETLGTVQGLQDSRALIKRQSGVMQRQDSMFMKRDIIPRVLAKKHNVQDRPVTGKLCSVCSGIERLIFSLAQ